MLNDAALTDISRAKRSGNADRTFYVGLGSGIRRDLSKNSAGSNGFRQDFMGAENTEPFLSENPNDGGKKSVVAGECGAADAGKDAGSLPVRTKVKKRGPADWADKNQILALMQPKKREDLARRAHSRQSMRIRRNHVGLNITSQTDNEYAASHGLSRCRHPARKRTTAREDTKG